MVLAGRQLVGIFALLVVMLGVVFTMGYVLGRSQYDTQIRAAASSVSPKAAGTPVKENSGSGTAKTSAAGKTPRATAPDWDFYHAGEPAKPVERLGGASDPVDAQPAPPEAVARAQPAARQPSEKQPTIIARSKASAGKGAAKAAGRTSSSRRDKSYYRSGGGSGAGRSSSEANTAAGASALKAAALKSAGIGAPVIPRGSTVLQVAAVARQADAVALAQALQKKKFPAFVTPPDGDHFYRVRVGPYVDAQLANGAREKLEEQGFKIMVTR